MGNTVEKSPENTNPPQNLYNFQEMTTEEIPECNLLYHNKEKSQSKVYFHFDAEKYKKFTLFSKLNHPNLYKILKINLLSYPNNFQLIETHIDYHSLSLHREVNRRFILRDDFPESGLYSLLLQMSKVLIHFERNQTFHGDIQLKNIYIDQNGVYKIYHSRLLRSSEYVPDQILTSRKIPVFYYSPEIIEMIYNSIQENREISQEKWFEVQNKLQVFQLGICLLQCGAMLEIDEFFSNEELVINDELVDYSMEIFQKKYSQNLYNLVEKMIQKNPDDRPTMTEVLNYQETEESSTLIQGQTRDKFKTLQYVDIIKLKKKDTITNFNQYIMNTQDPKEIKIQNKNQNEDIEEVKDFNLHKVNSLMSKQTFQKDSLIKYKNIGSQKLPLQKPI